MSTCSSRRWLMHQHMLRLADVLFLMWRAAASAAPVPGTPSASSVPPAPTDLVGEGNTVSWTPVNWTANAYRGYRVSCTSSDGGAYRSSPEFDCNGEPKCSFAWGTLVPFVRLLGEPGPVYNDWGALTPSKTYTCTVAANSTSGMGASSPPCAPFV